MCSVCGADVEYGRSNDSSLQWRLFFPCSYEMHQTFLAGTNQGLLLIAHVYIINIVVIFALMVSG